MMIPPLRRRKTLILILLSLAAASFFAPPLGLLFLNHPLPQISTKELAGDAAGRAGSVLQLEAVQQVIDGVKVPQRGIVYKDDGGVQLDSVLDDNVTAQGVENDKKFVNRRSGAEKQVQDSVQNLKVREGLSNQTVIQKDPSSSNSRPRTTEKIWEMEDQLITAKTYLQFSSPNSNSHLARQLRLRIREIQRVLSHVNKDSDLSKSDLQKIKAMEITLSKAHKAYPDCSAMASKLRAETYNAEEQLRAQQNQASHLVHLATRTFPKGLHCLSMRLTTEFFSLPPENRKLPESDNMNKSDMFHYAIFSDNVLACAVVVNSTISTSKETEKFVFHVITDSLNFPAMVMWFLLFPPGHAMIEIQNIDDLKSLPSGFSSMFMQPGVSDPRYTSSLNHLRFYLPEIFPSLEKVLLLDHDVVVQRELRELWSFDMKGKVNAAVQGCQEGTLSFKLEMLVNFSHPVIANMFDADSCVWAFGMNMFNLKEWRRQGLTKLYHEWQQKNKKNQLLKAGSLPMGQLVFYNNTVFLDHKWHVLGLGRDSNTGKSDIERAAVIHYDGKLKPWLELSVPKYRVYWKKFIAYDNPFLQQCNIHE